MPLPLELGPIQDFAIRRAFEQVSLQFPVAPAFPTGTLWGLVSSAGAISVAGSGGWTSTRTGVGSYTVTFTKAFAAAPMVLTTLSGDTANAMRVSTRSTTTFSVTAYTTAVADTAFMFLVFPA